MKKFSKIAAVVALMLVVCLSFTGCGNLGNAIISALSLDVTVDDPALIKVEDILDKTVKTESVKSGDFTYTLYTDNTACITGYTGSNPVVSIPAEIDGAKVIGLENKALKSSSTLKELILPDSVEAIGNYAAMYCDSLEKVTIGKNIKHIGISAFEGSQENAYTGKSKLTTVVFNGAPKTISEKAFYFCSALTEIVLPEGVETIGDWAFAKCFSAKKIIIPEGDEPIWESFEKLGCTVEILKLTDPANTREHIYDTLVNTDIVYAGGGNLEFMMNTFKATGADEALREAYKRGKVLSGLSSGAMCWFDMGYDDCGENGSFMFIDCIGLLPYCYCPHFISERWQSFETAVIGCRVSGIGAEDGAALIFKDGHFSAMCGNDGGSVFYFDKDNGFAKSDITEDASALDI